MSCSMAFPLHRKKGHPSEVTGQEHGCVDRLEPSFVGGPVGYAFSVTFPSFSKGTLKIKYKTTVAGNLFM